MWLKRKTTVVLSLICLLPGCGKISETPERQTSSVIFPTQLPLPTELPTPRYQFEVGQHLVYRMTESTNLMPEGDLDPPSTFQWDIFVTDRNDDGSLRLYIRKQIRLMRNTKDGDSEVRFENDILGYCDMQPDGSFAANELLGKSALFNIHPDKIFPPLPADAQKCIEGWTQKSPISDDTRVLKATAWHEQQLTLGGTIQNPSDVNYKQVVTQQINFDFVRGFPTAFARESKADWSVNPWHSRTVYELISVETVTDEWLQNFRTQAEACAEVSKRYWQLGDKAASARSRQECEATLDSMLEQLTQSQEAATLEELVSIYDAKMKLHNRQAKWALDDAEKREELYAMEPLDWETTDFDGKAQRLADYRGKVVVLDFWYRGCGHCIDALPTIKRLVTEYEGKDVAVLGMNNDRKDEDARYVIESFGLKYPSLRAKDIAKEYRVSGWPTFLVLDPTGRIAEVFEGNSANLYRNINASVDQLLSDQVAPARSL